MFQGESGSPQDANSFATSGKFRAEAQSFLDMNREYI